MKRLQLLLFALLMLGGTFGANAQTQWFNPMDGEEPYICGRAWNTEIGKTYNRIPERFKATVSRSVWVLSQHTAGLIVRFATTSHNIKVRYVCTSSHYGGYNMSGIDHSGIDLYGKTVDGQVHWIGSHMGWSMNKDTTTITFSNLSTLSYRGLEYTLYLPNYNGVKHLEIGVDQKSDFKFIHESPERPIVVYGSSIIQGASPSRPGLAITNIVEREMEFPIINLGFSGSCMMEPAMFDMIGEINARAFVIDAIPNSHSLADTTIIARTINGVNKLRAKSDAPILLCENHPIPDSVIRKDVAEDYRKANTALHKAFKTLQSNGVKKLYYLHSGEIKFGEEYMIEGTHPNDFGCRAYADAYEKKLREMLPEDTPDPRYPPVTQRRDGFYEWRERHNEVVRRNKTTDPEILMIGNSITHFWGGEPKSSICNGGDSWKKLFGKHRVTNMGFGYDRIENVYWRIFHGELDECSPKHIFLMIGINNSADKTEDIAGGIARLACLIHQRQPGAQLHVFEILPARGREEKVKAVNQLLKEKLEQSAQVELLEVYDTFLMKDGTGKINTEYFKGDGVHPNAKGYDLLRKRVAKIIK